MAGNTRYVGRFSYENPPIGIYPNEAETHDLKVVGGVELSPLRINIFMDNHGRNISNAINEVSLRSENVSLPILFTEERMKSLP